MEFDYDPAKSEANHAKHGIDFEQAQALWLDPGRTEISARDMGEPRDMVIGKIAGHFWSAVITRRGERIGIICVRRSRSKEVAIYEDHDR